MAERLLEVKGLKTHFFTDEGVVRAVDGIDLYINKGETLGIVGESGSASRHRAVSHAPDPQPPGPDRPRPDLLQSKNLLDLDREERRSAAKRSR